MADSGYNVKCFFRLSVRPTKSMDKKRISCETSVLSETIHQIHVLT